MNASYLKKKMKKTSCFSLNSKHGIWRYIVGKDRWYVKKYVKWWLIKKKESKGKHWWFLLVEYKTKENMIGNQKWWLSTDLKGNEKLLSAVT